MNSFFSKLNILLLMIWGEVIIFVISLLSSGIIINIIYKIFHPKISYRIYDSFKISTTLIIVAFLQFIYKNLLNRFLRKNLIKVILVLNSSAISILLMDKFIKKTVFSKYYFFYLALFISLILPFVDEIKDIYKIKKSKT